MENTRIAVTHKTSANQVFSFGRDHGYYGRIMSQAVIPLSTLAVRNGNRESVLHGSCFYDGDCEPEDELARDIRETADYILDAERLASS